MIDPNIQALLRQRFNPDGSQLRALQLRLLEMLKYIDSVCRKNNIHYWISSGTALGAVRHGGFIPWDDDADIEMMRSDYNKLINVLRKEPHPRYVLQDHESDVEYVGVLAKIRDTQSRVSEHNPGEEFLANQGVFIDIFCIEPSNTPKLNIFSHKIQLCCLFYVGKIKTKWLRRTIIRFNWFWITKLLFPALSYYGRIGNRERLRHAIGSGFPAERRYSEVYKTKHIDFEDTQLPVPWKVEKYLTRMFGDYKQLPPLDRLHTHTQEINI